ncbi:MAG: YfcE family phosphodiesterase [Candidatus Odinarchaeota archaeon]
MTLLVLGDLHIPGRAREINPYIREYLNRNKQSYELILCTGDLTSAKILDYLSTLGEFIVVRGNMDNIELPEYIVRTVHGLKLGLIHGDQVYPRGDCEMLSKIAKRLGVKILISGHTHSSFAIQYDKTILLNPGSVTGAWGGGDYSGIPEFMEADFTEDRVLTVYVHSLPQDRIVSVEHIFKI